MSLKVEIDHEDNEELNGEVPNTKEEMDVEQKLSLREMLQYGGQGLEKAGYRWHRIQKMGRKRVWKLEKDGEATTAAVRTSQDRSFAFPRKDDGWKTLDEVGADAVVVAAVDNPDRPRSVEVYVFPADEVRRRFDENYKARGKAGHTIVTTHRGSFGMWIGLDRQPDTSPSAAGSGLADDFPPVAVVPIADADGVQPAEESMVSERPGEASILHATTIADVIDQARRKIAEISGMPLDKVSLELRIG